MTGSEQMRLEAVERQLREQKSARELTIGVGLIVLFALAWKRRFS